MAAARPVPAYLKSALAVEMHHALSFGNKPPKRRKDGGRKPRSAAARPGVLMTGGAPQTSRGLCKKPRRLLTETLTETLKEPRVAL